jgi:hypothetical protein
MEYLGYGLASNAGWHVHAKLCHKLAALRAHPALHREGKRIWQQLHLVLMDVQIPHELLLASCVRLPKQPTSDRSDPLH